MKNMKFDQFYKRKWLNILKRTQNFRLRRAKQTTNREINYLTFVSAKIIHMEKNKQPPESKCGLRPPFWTDLETFQRSEFA